MSDRCNDHSAQDIRKELAKILESTVFSGDEYLRIKAALDAGKLLTYLVEKYLADDAVNENLILVEYFGRNLKYNPNDTIVRTRISLLRGRLAKYYATAGADDVIRISIPVGRYNVKIETNPRCAACKEINIGLYHLLFETPSHVVKGLERIKRAIEREPAYSEGYGALAAALVSATLHAPARSPKELLREAEIAARKALEINENSWRGTLNLHAVYLFRREWEKADEQFAIARQLRGLDVEDEGGTGPFWLARGKYPEAARLAKKYIDYFYTDAIYLRRAALYLYVLRRFKEAEECLQAAIDLDPTLWIAYLLSALNCLALNRPRDARYYLTLVEGWGEENLWPGLNVLCLAREGKPAGAMESFRQLLEKAKGTYVQPFQLALGYLAFAQHHEAIDQLRKALDEQDPFMIFMHLWPVLDPLREESEFRLLLESNGFPGCEPSSKIKKT
jgi:tetratricopeptide (TPR) repeat protein